ncbi:MAG: hypothetical protein ACOC9Q_00930 [bacterium]
MNAQMTDELSPRLTAISSRAAQWAGLLMLVEVYGLITLLYLR